MSAPLQSSVSLGSFWRSVKAVAWSFLGIRRSSASQEDFARIHPYHVIVVGIVGALLFVLGLVALVNWVVAP
jgi:Protein of unknown function (DUF2970)